MPSMASLENQINVYKWVGVLSVGTAVYASTENCTGVPRQAVGVHVGYCSRPGFAERVSSLENLLGCTSAENQKFSGELMRKTERHITCSKPCSTMLGKSLFLQCFRHDISDLVVDAGFLDSYMFMRDTACVRFLHLSTPFVSAIAAVIPTTLETLTCLSYGSHFGS